MRSLIYYIATSINGMIAARDGSTEDFSTDSALLDALAQTYPQTFPGAFHDQLGITDAARSSGWSTVIMGRETFEPALRAGIRSPYPHLDQYVVSTTLTREVEPDVTLVRDDPVRLVQRLKREAAGDIWLCGGGKLAASVADEIDRLIVKVNPITAGGGRPVIAGAESGCAWSLREVRSLPAGVVVLDYDRVRRD